MMEVEKLVQTSICKICGLVMNDEKRPEFQVADVYCKNCYSEDVNANFMKENPKRKITPTVLKEVMLSIVKQADDELFSISPNELAGEWWWKWDEKMSVEWNAYEFNEKLEMYKRRCRRWEEHHNGNCCVVERVRDKYLMPKIREFLTHGMKKYSGEL